MSETGFKGNPLWSEKSLSGMPAEELLKTARMQLFMSKKFFGRLAMRLQFIETQQIDTAAIDVRGRFYYNPYFINFCRLKDCIFVIAHEVFHLVQRTHARFPEGGLHSFWNTASDIINNQTLKKADLFPREQIQVQLNGYSEEHQKYDDCVTEEVYYDLIKNAKDNSDCEACKMIAEGILDEHGKRSKESNGDDENEGGENKDGDDSGTGDGDTSSESCGCGNSPGDNSSGDGKDCCDGEGVESDNGTGSEGNSNGTRREIPPHTCGNGACCSGVTSDRSSGKEVGDAEDWHKWQRGILGAAEGLDRGDLPGEVQRILDDLVKPSVTWKDVIRSKASAIFGKGRYVWKRPGRRSLATGIRFPSRDPEMLGALVWFDTSGSIGEECFRQFASESYGILTQTGCTSILVGCHDVNAYHLTEIKCKEDLINIPYRTGGTSHMDVFDVVEGKKGVEGIELPQGYKVGMVVCLTDMMSVFPSSCSSEVVWGIPSEYFHGRSEGWNANFGKAVEVTIDAHK